MSLVEPELWLPTLSRGAQPRPPQVLATPTFLQAPEAPWGWGDDALCSLSPQEHLSPSAFFLLSVSAPGNLTLQPDTPPFPPPGLLYPPREHPSSPTRGVVHAEGMRSPGAGEVWTRPRSEPWSLQCVFHGMHDQPQTCLEEGRKHEEN